MSTKPVKAHQVWVDLQGSRVAFHSLGHQPFLNQRRCHVVVGIRELGFQSQRRLHDQPLVILTIDFASGLESLCYQVD